MARNGDFGRYRQPPHWEDEYVKGEVHQSWAPDESYYPLFPKGGGGATMLYEIVSLAAGTGDYTGLIVATVTVMVAPCGLSSLIGTSVEVVDHSGCIFNEEDMTGYSGWAFEGVALSLDAGAECDQVTPCHWVALNRCCGPDTGTYATPCE